MDTELTTFRESSTSSNHTKEASAKGRLATRLNSMFGVGEKSESDAYQKLSANGSDGENGPVKSANGRKGSSASASARASASAGKAWSGEGSISTGLLSSEEAQVAAPTPTPTPTPPLSRQRWLILFLFCMCSVQQDMAWLLMSPIAREMETAFGPKWNAEFITWSLNLGNITFMICTLPIAWTVASYGRRKSTLLVIASTTFANMLRLLPVNVDDPSSNSLYRFFTLVCCAFAGLGGPWSMFGGPILSETWFPLHERVTATALGIMAPFVGQTATFLIGPLVVGQFPDDSVRQQQTIMNLFWGVFIVNIITWVAVWWWFDECPEFAPSQSAEAARERAILKRERGNSIVLPRQSLGSFGGPTTPRDSEHSSARIHMSGMGMGMGLGFAAGTETHVLFPSSSGENGGGSVGVGASAPRDPEAGGSSSVNYRSSDMNGSASAIWDVAPQVKNPMILNANANANANSTSQVTESSALLAQKLPPAAASATATATATATAGNDTGTSTGAGSNTADFQTLPAFSRTPSSSGKNVTLLACHASSSRSGNGIREERVTSDDNTIDTRARASSLFDSVPMTPKLWLGWADHDASKVVKRQAKRVRKFWILNLTVALPIGMIQAWASVLDLNLQPFGVTTMEAAYLGSLMTISGCIGSVLVGMYLDRFLGRVKSVSLVCLALSALFMYLFTVQLQALPSTNSNDDTRPSNQAAGGAMSQLYAYCILTGFFVNTAIPLWFELIMETVAGIIDEAMACAIQCMTNAVVQIVVLALPTRIYGSTIWLDWVTFASYVVALALLLIFKVEYVRTALDQKPEPGQKYVSVAKGCDGIGCL